jgi:hypothetical protein
MTLPECGSLAGSTAIVVLGAPRSGTSALTGTLHMLGVEVGEHLLPAGSSNPRGYWEHREITVIHDRLLQSLGRSWSDARPLPEGWLETRAAAGAARRIRDVLNRDFAGKALWAIKDPRLCRLVPLWRPMLRDLGVEPRYILALRAPDESIASLQRGIRFTRHYAELLWLRYVLEAEAATRDCRRTIVHYDDLLAGSEKRKRLIDSVAQALAVAWPVPADLAERSVAEFLSSELRHERSEPQKGPSVSGAEDVAQAFAMGDGAALHQICDRTAKRLGQIRIDQIEQPEAKRRIWIARRRDEIRALGERAGESLYRFKKSVLRALESRRTQV